MSEHQKKIYANVSNCLRYLETSGWSDLIDSRWKDQVVHELRVGFPDIDEETIVKVLNLVLV